MSVGNQVNLKEVFGSKPFTEVDIAKVLETTSSHAHYIRFKLISNQEIIRIARGMYKFHDQKQIQQARVKSDSFLEMLLPHLRQLGKQFKFTGASLLHQHVPSVFPSIALYLLYVEKGAAQAFQASLEDLHTKYTILIDPAKKDIELLMTKAGQKDFIIIREKNYFYSVADNKASLESAFVDFYFELSRQRLPYDDILTQLYLQLHTLGLINISTLQRYAKERALKEELLDFHQRHEKTIQVLMEDKR